MRDIIVLIGSILLVSVSICSGSCKSHNEKPCIDTDTLIACADTLITEADYAKLFNKSNLKGRFYFTDDSNLYKTDTLTYNLMNEIMQMSVTMPDSGANEAMFKWCWTKACTNVFRCYINKKHNSDAINSTNNSTDEASKNIIRLIKDYEGGTQSEMNTYFYVSTVLATYKGTKLYQDIQQYCSDETERLALYQDYENWINLSNDLMLKYSNENFGEGSYSSAPMDYDIECLRLWNCRCDELAKEMRVIRHKHIFDKSAFKWITHTYSKRLRTHIKSLAKCDAED